MMMINYFEYGSESAENSSMKSGSIVMILDGYLDELKQRWCAKTAARAPWLQRQTCTIDHLDAATDARWAANTLYRADKAALFSGDLILDGTR